MRRKIKHAIITPGRDRGKVFEIREMPADQGERWALRMLLALSRGGIEVPEGMFAGGWAGLANMWPYLLVIGLRSMHGAQWVEIEPLLDEMMGCVQWCPPGNAPPQPIFAGEDSQIEEVVTRIELRKAAIELHLGFSLAGDQSISESPPPSPPA